MGYKPEIRYVDMCIYIDNNVYNKNHDTEKIFHYLTELTHALSKKRNYFKSEDDYKDFSFYVAANLYTRLTDKRQFLKEEDPDYTPRIKSILNYINSMLSIYKIKYQELNFQKNYEEKYDGKFVSRGIEKLVNSPLAMSNSALIKTDTEKYLKNITNTIKKVVDDTYYSTDKVLKNNIYISCMLTFLDNLTLSNEDLLKLNDRLKENNMLEVLTNLHKKNCNFSTVRLWHLDNNMSDLISLLCVKIKEDICQEIRYIVKSHEDSDDLMQDILMLQYVKSYE